MMVGTVDDGQFALGQIKLIGKLAVQLQCLQQQYINVTRSVSTTLSMSLVASVLRCQCPRSVSTTLSMSS